MSHSLLLQKASCNINVAVIDLSGERCSDFLEGLDPVVINAFLDNQGYLPRYYLLFQG